MQNRFFRLFFIVNAMIFTPALVLGATNDAKLIWNKWPFNGIFGRFEESSFKRGFQVYKKSVPHVMVSDIFRTETSKELDIQMTK